MHLASAAASASQAKASWLAATDTRAAPLDTHNTKEERTRLQRAHEHDNTKHFQCLHETVATTSTTNTSANPPHSNFSTSQNYTPHFTILHAQSRYDTATQAQSYRNTDKKQAAGKTNQPLNARQLTSFAALAPSKLAGHPFTTLTNTR